MQSATTDILAQQWIWTSGWQFRLSTPGTRHIVTVFKEFGFDVQELKEDLFLKENKMVRIGEPPLRIEIMTSVSGVDFDACYEQRIVDTRN